jgi:L-threonylcarbamoyladenylate synthase
MPAHKIALRLIELCGAPVAAPSANPFGYLSPTEASHVEEQLKSDAPFILDGGKCAVGVESTIIKIEDGKNYLLRSGGIPVEEIREIIGDIIISGEEKIQAPGMLPGHYSPSTRLKFFSSEKEILSAANPAFLLFKNNDKNYPAERTEILSENGDLAEAASRLFSCLHRLDSLGADIIFAERVPETGLGAAIMDRLTRASLK